MRIAWGTTETADIDSEYLLPFHCHNGGTKESQYYVVCTLPVLSKCIYVRTLLLLVFGFELTFLEVTMLGL